MKSRIVWITSMLAFGAVLGWSLLLPNPVAAQEPVPTPSDDQVNEVAKQLYCPVCENISLDVCPTQACAQWRALIGEKIAAGWSDEQIKDYFVQQYGDRVLAEPPRRGLNWLVYVLPPLIILVGAYILFNTLRSMRSPRGGVQSAAAPAAPLPDVPAGAGDDPYLAKMEEELKRSKNG